MNSVNKIVLTHDNSAAATLIEPAIDNGIIVNEDYPKCVSKMSIVRHLFSASSAFKIYITDISIEDGDEEDREYNTSFQKQVK